VFPFIADEYVFNLLGFFILREANSYPISNDEVELAQLELTGDVRYVPEGLLFIYVMFSPNFFVTEGSWISLPHKLTKSDSRIEIPQFAYNPALSYRSLLFGVPSRKIERIKMWAQTIANWDVEMLEAPCYCDEKPPLDLDSFVHYNESQSLYTHFDVLPSSLLSPMLFFQLKNPITIHSPLRLLFDCR
jgi:hypothetical protein